jgi:hypothetical protein
MMVVWRHLSDAAAPALHMQPAVLSSLLQLLPAGIEELAAAGSWSDACMAALARFARLRRLRIAGSVAAIDWRTLPRCAPLALPAVGELSLDYRQEPHWYHSGWDLSEVLPAPERAVCALRSATRLRSFTLRCTWDERAQALLRLHPALTEVR